MARAGADRAIDRELAELPEAMRWRAWMLRLEAKLFASARPLKRADLAPLVGEGASLDLLLADLRAEYAERAFDLHQVAGGWAFRTRPAFADAVLSGTPATGGAADLRPGEAMALAVIAYHQPITRAGMAEVAGAEIGREVLARLRQRGLIANGPRGPTRGAPQSFVTTDAFLDLFNLNSLADLPDVDDLVGGPSDAALDADDRRGDDEPHDF